MVILVGSAFKARGPFNPWKYEERKQIILAAMPPELAERVYILPLRDSEYNDDQWDLNVHRGVEEAAAHFFGRSKVDTALVGHSKDHSSSYLLRFPQWTAIEVPNYKLLSATPIRENYFVNSGLSDEMAAIYSEGSIIAPSTIDFLKEFERSLDFEQMVREFRFNEKHNAIYADLPYPPIFVTADVLIVKAGHVGMIRRRNEPGRNLLAMPGGYVNAHETIEDAAYRELREETGLTRKTVGKYEKVKVFDAPNRSARGRIITHCFLFRLPDEGRFPKMRAGDDAKKAGPMPINSIALDECFEDHYAIIHNMLETHKF